MIKMAISKKQASISISLCYIKTAMLKILFYLLALEKDCTPNILQPQVPYQRRQCSFNKASIASHYVQRD
jgi:hypothetical protein